jgi:intergrase/recombinase
MGKKVTIYSGKSMKNTLERLQRIADKIEEKENRSMARSVLNFVTKKPVIGKESITKKVMRKLKKNDSN